MLGLNVGFPGGSRQRIQVQSLAQEDPLEEGMAIHSSILARRVPWTEESGSFTVHSVAKSQTQLKQLNMQARAGLSVACRIFSLH